jgi:hypothetical protein
MVEETVVAGRDGSIEWTSSKPVCAGLGSPKCLVAGASDARKPNVPNEPISARKTLCFSGFEEWRESH